MSLTNQGAYNEARKQTVAERLPCVGKNAQTHGIPITLYGKDMFKAGDILRHKPTGDIGVVIVAREGMVRDLSRYDVMQHCLGENAAAPLPDSIPLNAGDLCVLRRGQLYLIIHGFKWEVVG